MYIVYSQNRSHTRVSRVLKNRKQVKANIESLRQEFPECRIIVAQVTQLWDIGQHGEWWPMELKATKK